MKEWETIQYILEDVYENLPWYYKYEDLLKEIFFIIAGILILIILSRIAFKKSK